MSTQHFQSFKSFKLPWWLFDGKGTRFAVSFYYPFYPDFFLSFFFFSLKATLHYCFMLSFDSLWLEVCPVAILFGVFYVDLRSWVKQHKPQSEVCICYKNHVCCTPKSSVDLVTSAMLWLPSLVLFLSALPRILSPLLECPRCRD